MHVKGWKKERRRGGRKGGNVHVKGSSIEEEEEGKECMCKRTEGTDGNSYKRLSIVSDLLILTRLFVCLAAGPSQTNPYHSSYQIPRIRLEQLTIPSHKGDPIPCTLQHTQGLNTHATPPPCRGLNYWCIRYHRRRHTCVSHAKEHYEEKRGREQGEE